MGTVTRNDDAGARVPERVRGTAFVLRACAGADGRGALARPSTVPSADLFRRRRTAVGAGPLARPRWQSPHLDELAAERRDVGEDPLQLGRVRHPSDEQGLGGRARHLERVEGTGERRRQPAGDPEGVLNAHVVLLSVGIVPVAMVGGGG